MEVWRTWCMEWRSIYQSSYIHARSLQDHMEVGMGQFGVKVNKKSTSGWANSSIGLYTRVWSVFNTSGISGQGILEYGSVYSSIQLLSALQLHTVSRSARATSDVLTISHKPEIGLRWNQWHLKLDIQCVMLIYNPSQKVSRWRSYGFYKLTHMFTSCSRPSFNVLSISHNLQILLC